MKLLSSVAYGVVLRNKVIEGLINYEKYFELRDSYDGFLSEQLTLSMFVPCKEVGSKWVVLGEPVKPHPSVSMNSYAVELEMYNDAKVRVLFEGYKLESYKEIFTLIHVETTRFWNFANFQDKFYSLTIENLSEQNLTLTQSAQKQIGL